MRASKLVNFLSNNRAKDDKGQTIKRSYTSGPLKPTWLTFPNRMIVLDEKTVENFLDSA